MIIRPSSGRTIPDKPNDRFKKYCLKTTGKANTKQRPLLKSENSTQCCDAVLAFDKKIPLLDNDGKPTTIRDGHSSKTHPSPIRKSRMNPRGSCFMNT